jgi:hypothetical protein
MDGWMDCLNAQSLECSNFQILGWVDGWMDEMVVESMDQLMNYYITGSIDEPMDQSINYGITGSIYESNHPIYTPCI